MYISKPTNLPLRRQAESTLFSDLTLFTLKSNNFRSIIDVSPLQAYSSAIVFAPKTSVIRNTFQEDIPKWISVLPKVELEWGACRQTIEGHGYWVNAVAFSPDGKTVASASFDNTVRLWNVVTGEERQRLEGHGNSINAVAFSPDAKTVASGSEDKTVRLWNVVTGEERQRLEGHGDSINAVAFSPDGKIVASGSEDKTVRLWDAATGEERQTLEIGHALSSLSFSTDSRHLKTDRGLLSLESGSQEISPLHATSDHALMFGKDWVTHNGRRILWLPPDYRPDKMACYENTFALGYHSGLVKTIQFTF